MRNALKLQMQKLKKKTAKKINLCTDCNNLYSKNGLPDAKLFEFGEFGDEYFFTESSSLITLCLAQGQFENF